MAWHHGPVQLPKLTDKTRTLAILVVTLGVALAVAVGLTELFGEILESIGDEDGVAAWDRPVLEWAIGARTPGLTAFIVWYSNTGGPLWQPIVTGIVVVFLSWRWRDITPLVLMVIATGGSLLITVLGKHYIGRARPPLEDAIPPYESSMSYPSGHSLNALVIAGILAYLLIRHLWDRAAWIKWLIAGVLIAYGISMGLTRVYLGHHWLTDVLGAWVIGLAWLTVVIACHRAWRTVRRRAESGPIEEGQPRPGLDAPTGQ